MKKFNHISDTKCFVYKAPSKVHVLVHNPSQCLIPYLPFLCSMLFQNIYINVTQIFVLVAHDWIKQSFWKGSIETRWSIVINLFLVRPTFPCVEHWSGFVSSYHKIHHQTEYPILQDIATGLQQLKIVLFISCDPCVLFFYRQIFHTIYFIGRFAYI